jgi:hypothetical protein
LRRLSVPPKSKVPDRWWMASSSRSGPLGWTAAAMHPGSLRHFADRPQPGRQSSPPRLPRAGDSRRDASVEMTDQPMVEQAVRHVEFSFYRLFPSDHQGADGCNSSGHIRLTSSAGDQGGYHPIVFRSPFRPPTRIVKALARKRINGPAAGLAMAHNYDLKDAVIRALKKKFPRKSAPGGEQKLAAR